MPMNVGEIEQLIKTAMPDAKVTIEDLAGDGDHYAAYQALQGRMGNELHALALQTTAPTD